MCTEYSCIICTKLQKKLFLAKQNGEEPNPSGLSGPSPLYNLQFVTSFFAAASAVASADASVASAAISAAAGVAASAY